MPAIDVKAYKKKIILDLIQSEIIVAGIDSQKEGIATPDDLIYKNIFPYLHIDFVQTIADTYILVGIDQVGINAPNTTFANLRITVWVAAHVDRQRFVIGDTPSTRVDYLAEQVAEILDGNLNYGFGVLELVASSEVVFNDKYQYRELVFHTVDLTARSDRKVWR